MTLRLRGDVVKIEAAPRPELTHEQQAIVRALKRLPIGDRAAARLNLRSGRLVIADGRLVPPATRAKR